MPASIFGRGHNTCPVGQRQLDDGSCVPESTVVTCGKDEVLQGGKCVPVKTDTATDAAPKKSNTAMWVAGGIGVAALAGFMFLAGKKKREEG